MSTPSDSNIQAWARQELGADDTEVPNIALALYLASEKRRVAASYPCILSGGVVTLSDDEIAIYEEAVGIRIAARYLGSPSGKQITARLLSVKVGPVTEQYGQTDTASLVRDLMGRAAATMRLIACVGTGAAALTMYAVNGRRRTEGEPSNVLDSAFGEDDDAALED